MTPAEQRATEFQVAEAIVAAADVYPEDWFREWARAWMGGDERARTMAEAIRKMVRTIHVDPMAAPPAGGLSQQGDPFLEILHAYARAEGRRADELTAEEWLSLARRVRAEHPDAVPDEQRSRAAGAEAARAAAHIAQWWLEGLIDAAAVSRFANRARMWAIEAAERSGTRSL